MKIADFDISTQVCGLNTKQRSCVGTPWYTAPEVILVEPYSYSADIWSLGCTVYQLATGVCPYAKYGAVQAMFQMVNNGCPEYPDNFKPREDLKDFTDNCFPFFLLIFFRKLGVFSYKNFYLFRKTYFIFILFFNIG